MSFAVPHQRDDTDAASEPRMTFLASLLDERDAYRLLLSVALANSHADQRVIARLREELREQRETWTRCAERLMNDD